MSIATDESLARYPDDAYEPQAVLYFHFKGRQMVAIVRAQSEFDEPIANGDSLDGHAARQNVSPITIEASKQLFSLIPKAG